MNARRWTSWVGFGLAIAVSAAGAIFSFHRLTFQYTPGTAHQSAFLQSYNPRPLIESLPPRYPFSISDGLSSSAGRKFVASERKIDPQFVIKNDMRAPTMIALREDIAAQLVRNGSRIVSRSGDVTSGFQFSYIAGTNVGTVKLLPLTDQTPTSFSHPLPEGDQEVHADIAIAEKWFPQATEALQASLEPR